MNWFRITLLASIGFVLILLLQRWTEFSQAVKNQERIASEEQPHAAVQASRRDITEHVPPQEASVAEPPGASPDAGRGGQDGQPPGPTQADVVRIRTGLFHMDVNLRGGDIQYLALPQYPRTQKDPSQPLVILEKTPQRQFLVQSGLLSPKDITPNGKRPLYQSTQKQYTLEDGQDSLRVLLRHQNSNGIRIEKSFTLNRASYRVRVHHTIVNDSEHDWQLAMFGQLQRSRHSDPRSEISTFSPASFLGMALNTPEKPYLKLDWNDLRKRPVERAIPGGWIALVQHYFVSAWIPPGSETHLYRASAHNNERYLGSWVGPRKLVPAGARLEMGADLYVGPKIQKELQQLAPGLDLTVDYGWLWWLAQPLALLLYWLHGLLGNWGLAIIGLTFLVKLVFYPLSNIGYRSTAKMRLVQPAILSLRNNYTNDRQKLSQELMNLYRKEKINPMGGCLPILVQMPVFLALYWVLLESVELRHAAFYGWITDLSVMDPWFILPILMGISMFFQQKMNPVPPDPTQAAIIRWLPPILTVFFLFFPAGLVLYWLVNNLLSMLQQFIVNRQIGVSSPRQS